MRLIHPNRLPYLVAIAEGFSTLAVEVIAIRLAIPVVGSSMTLTGVMLAVVLFALSAGYWSGGRSSSEIPHDRLGLLLARNLFAAGLLLAVIAFPFEASLLDALLDRGLDLAPAIGLTACFLFAPPVYLASQTVPMLAELTSSDGKVGKASGEVLFFSTLGSVAGGIVTPIYLFPSIGVRYSTFVVLGLLLAGAAVMAAGRAKALAIAAAGVLGLAVALTPALLDWRPAAELFAFDSPHQSIRVIQETEQLSGRLQRIMVVGGGRASGIYADTGETSFAYVREAEAALVESRAQSVLVIGAAGFTLPRDAAALPNVQEVDAVDVDPEVRPIAERHFLRSPLPPRVRFHALSGRDAVRRFSRERRRYGFAFLDAYSGKGIPDELLTVEFLAGIRGLSDVVVANVITDRDLESAFSRNVLASFQQAFGAVWLKDVKPESDDATGNILIANRHMSGYTSWKASGKPYFDDRNTADRDRVRMLWGDGD